MKNKKFLFFFTNVTIMLLVIAACTTPTQAPAVVDVEAPASGETVTITVWDFGGAEFQWMDEIAIPAFNQEFPNIIVNHIGIPEEELGLKLETAIAAGSPPDLVVFPPTRIFPAGHVLPLDDYMARDGLSRDSFCPLFHGDNLSAGGNTFRGKTYGLPIDTNVWAMIYNKDLFTEAGLPEIKATDYITFDTWLEYARAINKPADSLGERVWGSAMFTPVFNSMAGYMSDPFVLGDDGRTCTGNADTSDWVHTYEVQLAAYQEDVTTETAGPLLADVDQDMFLQGKIGMTYGALGDALNAEQQGLNVGLVGQPIVTEGWRGNVGGWNTTYYLMAASQHPDEAWEFLKWLSTKSPLVVPIGTDALDAGEGGLPGIPCYLPLLELDPFAEQVEQDPLVRDAVELMTNHYQRAPFTPDAWTSLDPFYEAWTRITLEGADIQSALSEAAEVCQEITDELWEDYDLLGQ